jgi:hypothetical protein
VSTKITRDVLEAFLNCRYKGHLKLTGKSGDPPEYQGLLDEALDEARSRTIDTILGRRPEEEVKMGVDLTKAVLNREPVSSSTPPWKMTNSL